MKNLAAIFAVLFVVIAVVSAKPPSATKESKDVLAAQLGKQVTLIGVAENHKLGAFLGCKDFGIAIDGIHRWPEEFEGKQVSVTGIVIERFDLPVFIRNPNGPDVQGIPVPPGTDLHKASHRYLLKGAKWKLH